MYGEYRKEVEAGDMDVWQCETKVMEILEIKVRSAVAAACPLPPRPASPRPTSPCLAPPRPAPPH